MWQTGGQQLCELSSLYWATGKVLKHTACSVIILTGEIIMSIDIVLTDLHLTNFTYFARFAPLLG